MHEQGSPTQEMNSAGACPLNRQPGKPVEGQTVKALLAVSLREVRATEYRFCSDEHCPIVYFSTDGSSTFTTHELRERVYQKEPSAPDVLICYCFQHTRGELQAADHATQHAIIEDITRGIQAGQCACDLRNPQGSCCLGNVRSLVRVAQQLA